MKTKPTQHSVERLRQIGIQPDILICRTERRDRQGRHRQDRPVLQRRAAGGHRGARQGVQHLRGAAQPGRAQSRRVDRREAARSRRKPLDIGDWRDDAAAQMKQPGPRSHGRRRRQIHPPQRRLQIDLRSARPRRHRRARPRRRPQDRGGGDRARRGRARAERPRRRAGARRLRLSRHRNGKIDAIRFARETQGPVLRHLPGPAMRRHRVRPQRRRPGRRQQHRIRPQLPHPVVCMLDEQYSDHRQGRHHAARLVSRASSSRAASPIRHTARSLDIEERHRHRYEFNNQYRSQFEANGLERHRHQPQRQAGRDRRAARPSVVRGGAVPSGVQVEADRGASAVPRVHRGVYRAAGGKKKR